MGATIQGQSCHETSVCATTDVALAAEDKLSAAITNSSCSSAQLSIAWTVDKEDIGRTVRICALPQDSSTQCYGQGPADATLHGWYGAEKCALFKVAAAVFKWVDYYEGNLFDAYVGCTFLFRVGLVQSIQGYYAYFQATEMPSDASAQQEPKTGGMSVVGTISWLPTRGTEGHKFTFCYLGNDGLVVVTTALRCFNVSVGKCRYCLEGNTALQTIRRVFGLNMDWLRLWTLNADTPAALGLAGSCSLLLNCVANDNSSSPLFDNPTIALQPNQNKTILWVGALIQSNQPQSLVALAARFRTTVKSILSVNPDQETPIVDAGDDICLIPCTSAM